MIKITLMAIAVFYGLVALIMWFAPLFWYETTPGVAMMGPFNLHFIRDIALTFALASGALAWGAWKVLPLAGLFGAAWPPLSIACWGTEPPPKMLCKPPGCAGRRQTARPSKPPRPGSPPSPHASPSAA